MLAAFRRKRISLKGKAAASDLLELLLGTGSNFYDRFTTARNAIRDNHVNPIKEFVQEQLQVM
jgi:hypothetical protein